MSKAPSKTISAVTSARKAPIRHCCGLPSLNHPRDYCPNGGTMSSTRSTPALTPASTPAPQAPSLHVHNVFTAPAQTPVPHHYLGPEHQGLSVSAVEANGLSGTPTPVRAPPQQLQRRRMATSGPSNTRNDQWEDVTYSGEGPYRSQPQTYQGEDHAEWEIVIAGWRHRGRLVVDARVMERPSSPVSTSRGPQGRAILCWVILAALLGAAVTVLVLASLAR